MEDMGLVVEKVEFYGFWGLDLED